MSLKKTDYENDNGMLTTVWGPSLWHSIHTISFNYPVKPTKREQADYYKFIMSLEKVLPCRYCRENFSKNMDTLDKKKKTCVFILCDMLNIYVKLFIKISNKRFSTSICVFSLF